MTDNEPRLYGTVLFRELDVDEVERFRKWAQMNYQPGEPIKEIWHPVVQAECALINAHKDSGESETWQPRI